MRARIITHSFGTPPKRALLRCHSNIRRTVTRLKRNPLPPSTLNPAWLLPPAVFLFILPFAHSIALRWIAALLTLAIAAWQYLRGRNAPGLPAKTGLALWALALLLSLVWAVNPVDSFSELKVDVAYSLLMFLAFYGLTQGVREFRCFLLAMAVGSVTISLLAIGYRLWYGDWMLGLQNARGEFATCMVTTLPAILLLALRDTPWSSRRPYVLGMLPVLLGAGLFTQSRMFLGALILMMVVAVALQGLRHRINLRQTLFAAGVAGALAAIAVLAISDERGVGLGDDLRPAIWSFAWNRIQQHPWTGTGYGYTIMRRDYIQQFPDMGIFHPHNIFLSYAEQAGALGMLGLCAVFAALGWEYWRLYRSDARATNYIGVAGIAMLIGVLAKNMTDMFFVRECALLFWSVNGVLLGYGRRAASGST
jgi:O-antigen ligase